MSLRKLIREEIRKLMELEDDESLTPVPEDLTYDDDGTGERLKGTNNGDVPAVTGAMS
jgi:hypothetical protein